MHASKDGAFTVAAIFMVLPLVAITLRIWARQITKTRLNHTDWLIFAATACCTGSCISMIIGAAIGDLGAHTTPPVDENGNFIHTETYRIYSITKFLVQLFSILTVGLTKLSLLFFFRSIFAVPTFRRINTVVVVIVAAWTVVFTMATIFQCYPVSNFWNLFDWESEKTCIDRPDFYIVTAISDFVTDAIVLALPLAMVWKLQLPKQQKLAVAGMFLLGAFVCMAGVVRISILFVTKLYTAELTHEEASSIFWTVIEASVAVVCACLPLLRPVFNKRAYRKIQSCSSMYSTKSSDTQEHRESLHRKSSASDPWFSTDSPVRLYISAPAPVLTRDPSPVREGIRIEKTFFQVVNTK